MALTYSDTANYRGVLFLLGKTRAPFLNAIAGRARRTGVWTFPLGSPWNLSAASQDAIAETTSVSAGTPTTVTRGQDSNVIQIMKKDIAVSFKKQSLAGSFSGINSNDAGEVLDELGFQKRAQLMQLAIDMDFSCLQGSYTAESATSTITTTRGLKNAITTNSVAAGSKKLEKAMIEELVREMIDSGAPFDNIIMVCNAFQMQMLSDIYGFAPMDRTRGGVAIDSFLIPGAGEIRTLFDPHMPTDEIYLAEMSVCAPVFVPVEYIPDGNITPQKMSENGVDVLFQPSSPDRGAARGGFFYTQFGFDYGPEEYHGSITGLATSA